MDFGKIKGSIAVLISGGVDSAVVVHQLWPEPVPIDLQQDDEGYYLLGSVQDWRGFADHT